MKGTKESYRKRIFEEQCSGIFESIEDDDFNEEFVRHEIIYVTQQLEKYYKGIDKTGWNKWIELEKMTRENFKKLREMEKTQQEFKVKMRDDILKFWKEF